MKVSMCNDWLEPPIKTVRKLLGAWALFLSSNFRTVIQAEAITHIENILGYSHRA